MDNSQRQTQYNTLEVGIRLIGVTLQVSQAQFPSDTCPLSCRVAASSPGLMLNFIPMAAAGMPYRDDCLVCG